MSHHPTSLPVPPHKHPSRSSVSENTTPSSPLTASISNPLDPHALFHERNKLLHALILSNKRLFKLKQTNGMLYSEEKWDDLNEWSFVSVANVDALCEHVLQNSDKKDVLPRSIVLDEDKSEEILRLAREKYEDDAEMETRMHMNPIVESLDQSQDITPAESSIVHPPTPSDSDPELQPLPRIEIHQEGSEKDSIVADSPASPSAFAQPSSPSLHPAFAYNQQQYNQALKHTYEDEPQTTPTTEDEPDEDDHTDTSSVGTESDESWLLVDDPTSPSPSSQTPIDPERTFKQIDKRLSNVIQSTADKRQSGSGLFDRFSLGTLKSLATKYWYGTSENPTQRKWADWIPKFYPDMRADGLRISKVLIVRSHEAIDEILVRIREKPEIFKDFNNTLDSFVEYVFLTFKVTDKDWVDVHVATRDIFYFSCAFASLLMTEVNPPTEVEEKVYKLTRDCIQAFVLVECYEYLVDLFFHCDSNALISKRILGLKDAVSVHSLELCPEMCLHRTPEHKVYETAITHLKQIEHTLDVYEQLDILYQSFCFCWSEFDQYYTEHNPQEYQKNMMVQSNEITKLLCYIFLKSGIEVLPCVVSLVSDLVDRNSITKNHIFLLEASRVALNWMLSIQKKESQPRLESQSTPQSKSATSKPRPILPPKPTNMSLSSPASISPLAKSLPWPVSRSASTSTISKPLPMLPTSGSRFAPPEVQRSASFSDIRQKFDAVPPQ